MDQDTLDGDETMDADTISPVLFDNEGEVRQPVNEAPNKKNGCEGKEISGYPVDRGWAWMIVLGTFGMHIFTVGAMKSFGVLFIEFEKNLKASSGAMAGVMSLATFFMMALGPVSAMLSSLFTCRVVVFIGGCLMGLGFLISAFVSDIGLLYITYSTITGVGYGLSYVPCIVMVGYHFEKKRSLANGLAVSGSGLGNFILPNLMRGLLDAYSFKGAMVILAAFMTNVCVCSMLFRPLEFYKNRPKSNQKSSQEDEGLQVDKCIPVHDNNYSDIMEMETVHPVSGIQNVADDRHLLDDSMAAKRKLAVSSSLISGSLGDIVLVSMQDIPVKTKQIQNVEKPKCWYPCFSYLKNNKLFDCSLVFNPLFLVYAFTVFFYNFGYNCIFMMIPSFAVELHLSESQGAFLVSLIGLADMFGRLFFGWVSDYKCISRKYTFFFCVFVCSVLNFSVIFITEFVGFAAFSTLYGLFAGSFISLIPVVLVDALGLECLSSSFGLTTLITSFAVLSSPPIIGWIRDESGGSWKNSFHFCAGFLLLSSLMIVFEKPARLAVKKRAAEAEDVLKEESNGHRATLPDATHKTIN